MCMCIRIFIYTHIIYVIRTMNGKCEETSHDCTYVLDMYVLIVQIRKSCVGCVRYRHEFN